MPDQSSDQPEATTAQEQKLAEALAQVAADRPVGDAWASIRSRVTDPAATGVVVVADGPRRRNLRTSHLAAAAVVAVALIGGALAFGNLDGDGDDTTEVTVGAEDGAAPARGGTVRYGLPSLPSVGFCLTGSMYGTDDEIVIGAIFDPLVTVDDTGAVTPYLAESVTPSTDHTVWTVKLRPGITFHDGSPLDAEIVKDNIDAQRGAFEGRASLLNTFHLRSIAAVDVIDDLTVEVTTSGPWVNLPAFLASPSLGIMARAQLEADPDLCAESPIGTGPFVMDSWSADEGTATLVRNRDYWQSAPDGQPYPYLDTVEFVTTIDPTDLGDHRIDVLWTSSATTISGPLAAMEAAGTVDTHLSYQTAQPAFVLLNHMAPPFDDPAVRRALAMSLDRDAIADEAGLGPVVPADGPFAPSTLGHVEDPGFPSTDPDAARAIIADYVEAGGSAAFELLAIEGTDDEAIAVAIEGQAEAVGFDVSVIPLGTAELMDDLISGTRLAEPAADRRVGVNAAIHRNPPATDPDQLSIWWRGGANPVNFSRFDDPAIDELLTQGRADPAGRAQAYQDITTRFAEQVHSMWLWYQPAAVAARPGTGSIIGPELPDGSARSTDLSLPHSLLGITAP